MLVVLDGQLECAVADQTVTAAAAETVWIPRGTPHTFEVTGSRDARFLFWYSPGGFEGYFAEMGEFIDSLPPGPPDTDAVGKRPPS